MRDSDIPELGVGIACGNALESYGTAAGYDFREVSPHADTVALRGRHPGSPVVLASAWLPVGGSCEPDPALLALLAENVEALRPAFVAERLGFNRFPTGGGSRATGFLLPPCHTLDGVTVAARRIAQLRERLRVPIAFEIGTNYLPKRRNELTDAEFFAAVAEAADCGIVLDLTSIWANEFNGREDAAALLERLPLERVWEVQVSGATTCRGYAVDTQSGLAQPGVRRLAERFVPHLPALRAIVFEARAETLRFLGQDVLSEQREWLGGLWASRGTNVSERNPSAPMARRFANLPPYGDACVRLRGWEREVVAGIAGITSANASEAKPFALLDSLIAGARKTAIAEAAQFSLRLLEATLGPRALADLFQRYFSQTCAEQLPVTEAVRFLQFVESERTDVPYLREVVAFERAAAQALRGAGETAVLFSCEPTEIFRALLRRDQPYVSDRRPHLVHVGPRGIRIEGAYHQAG
jgi:uncharacterized protein (UPF0276 family)